MRDRSHELRERIFETYVERRYAHESLKPYPHLEFSLEDIRETLGEAAPGSFDMTALFWRRYGETRNEMADAAGVASSIRRAQVDRANAFANLATRLNFLVGKECDDSLRCVHQLLRDHFAEWFARIVSRSCLFATGATRVFSDFIRLFDRRCSLTRLY